MVCYTVQGSTALLVVEGLLSLLNATPFFVQDVPGNEDRECIVDDSTTTAVSTTHPRLDHHEVPSPDRSSAEVRLC